MKTIIESLYLLVAPIDEEDKVPYKKKAIVVIGFLFLFAFAFALFRL